MIILYDCATAPSPRCARILLAEKGIAHETVQVDLVRGEQMGAAYRAINPQCTVPALRTAEDGLLTDNAAIAAWAEARHPEPPLMGRTPAEKAEVAKANPGKFTYASSGYGGSPHLAAELFKLTTGTDIVHVPFTGSAPAITALLGGHVDLIFDTIPSIWPNVQNGKLRALAVASAKRAPSAPDIPAIAETLPGFDVTSWEGILAPKGTPEPVVAKIAEDIRRATAEPAFVESLTRLHAGATSNTPEEFTRFIADEYAKWQRVVREAGIKVE